MKWLFPISSILITPVCKMRSEHWLRCLYLFKDELSNCQKNGILFLGDSLTEEFHVSQYFPGFPIINRGISGDTIEGVIERIDISAIRLEPSKIFLMIGINDIGSDMTEKYIQLHYTRLLTLLQDNLPQSELYVLSLLPVRPEWGKSMPGQIKKINKFIHDASRKNTITFINLFASFIDSNGYLKENLTNDGLHLNSNGYDLWAKELMRYLQPEINND